MTFSRRDFNYGIASTAALLSTPFKALQVSAETHEVKTMLALQQNFVDLRFGMFLHFNMATFQDREWGDPTSPPTLFHPAALDTDQWAEVAKSAKMTWGCLTTRHHDGFCIWPTETHADSVAKVPHSADVVAAYAASFRKAGLRVGLYYSILSLRDDIRHFNVTPAKVQLIKDQLTELFTNYGAIDILITDGWDAPWSRITYEEVPFREIYDHVKSLQPQCLICDLNAASYPTDGLYYSDIKAFEQNAGQKVPQDSDLPALSCVTLTDGWFWKQADLHGTLKPAEPVVQEWLIPLNRRHCNLILNAPPTREGRLAPNVVEHLRQIGALWQPEQANNRLQAHASITTPNLATGKPIHASSSPDTIGPDLANDGNFRTSWSPDSADTSPWLEIDLGREHRISTVALVQGRPGEGPSTMESFVFESWTGSAWATVTSQANRSPTSIVRVSPVTARRFRVRLIGCTGLPSISDVGLYDEPARISGEG